MEEMSSSIEKLTSLVNDLMVDKMRRDQPEPHKKRKAYSPYDEMQMMDLDPGMAGRATHVISRIVRKTSG
jgi:hypothetical protein